MKSILLIAVLLGFSAHAEVTFQETIKGQIKSFENLNFKCDKGIPSNGHNFPTSSFGFVNVIELLPISNITAVSHYDMEHGTGDTCAAMEAAMRARTYPIDVTIEHSFESTCEMLSGKYMSSVMETAIEHLGNTDLANQYMDQKSFLAGPCTPPAPK